MSTFLLCFLLEVVTFIMYLELIVDYSVRTNLINKHNLIKRSLKEIDFLLELKIDLVLVYVRNAILASIPMQKMKRCFVN